MMQKKEKNEVNKNILVVTYIFMGLFLILAGYFAYLFAWSGRDLVQNPYNKLFGLMADSVTRGDIYSADGKLLATTGTDEDGEEYRSYPYHEMYCHVVGSVEKGMTGLESAYNYELLTSSENIFTKIAHDFSDEKDRGNNIITTLDSKVQEAAVNALSGYEGAAIVMNSKTGEVLAMVSNPGYDPAVVGQEWEKIQESSSSVLLNRATQGLYTPGSIFKIVTLYEYLREDGDEEGYSYDCDGSTRVDGEVIHCNDGLAHGQETLMDSFAYSCNSSFVHIGQQLSLKKYLSTCEDLLFNKKLPVKLEYNQSRFALSESDSDFVKAQTFFGQGETLVTPIHMAILMQALANDGVAMEPKFVNRVTGASGNTVKTVKDKEYKRLFSEELAKKMKTYLRSVVEYGTAKRLNDFENLTVYGKTGSGEIDSRGNYNSWFVGYAENEANGDNYTVVVVAENVERGSSGPSVAIAHEIWKVLD